MAAHGTPPRGIDATRSPLFEGRFGRMFREIMEVYSPREPVDVDQLADMVSSVLEGGIVLSKTLKEPNTLAEQVLMLRIFVRMLFLPAIESPLVAVRHEHIYGTVRSGDQL